MFVSAQEMWINDLDRTDHVLYDLRSTTFPFYLSTLVTVRSLLAGLNPVALCNVAISFGILHGDDTKTELFLFDVELTDSFAAFVGSYKVLEDTLSWNSSFCGEFVIFTAEEVCTFGSYSAKDNIQKIAFVECYGNVLTWENLKVICILINLLMNVLVNVIDIV